MQKMKIIISGGGTGGHIFPALAIANALKSKIKDVDILFVGAKGKMEMKKIPNAGYNIRGLWISGFHRKVFDFRNLLFPIKLFVSLLKSYFLIKNFKPNVIVGTGGFASGPLLYVGAKMNVPALIQEQNSYPGITNKLLSKIVQKICVSYEDMERFFKKEKILLLGNPIRQDILLKNLNKNIFDFFNLRKDKKTVLFIGGSLGALTINESAAEFLKINDSNTQILWQTGDSYFLKAKAKSKNCNNVKVLPFIKEMNFAYSVADIIVSRAGASTISELCLIGKPVILVPSPNVAEDHQTKNATFLVNKNAAMMINDNEAKKIMPIMLRKLLNDTLTQTKLAKNIKKLAIYDSASNIADEIIKLAHKK